ncbi:hypothetical protein GCM10023093_29610 [Nemorincola caseinilytica]|uniref:EGF-like domain-containing protein n=1 Tax=Nemorincola caseinilytica TaxID=2054315 RepID=A0ABP8NQM7_9BACT
MMKQTKAIVYTVILTLLAFGSVVYTACRKDYCKNMVCQHGGTCNDGACICPQGFTGTYCQTPNVSSIGFRNNTFTPVTITVNGAEYRVDTGSVLTFTGSHGDTLKGTAKTHGQYGLNVDLPAFKIVFPVRNTLYHDLDAPDNTFFLMATNNSPVPYITQVHVFNDADSVLDITVINNTGAPHYIGYYNATLRSKVRLEKTPYRWSFDTLSLPMTKNQYFNAIAN